MEVTGSGSLLQSDHFTPTSDSMSSSVGMDITSFLSSWEYEIPDTGRSVGGVCTGVEGTKPANGTEPESFVQSNNLTPSLHWIAGTNETDITVWLAEFGNEREGTGSNLEGVLVAMEGNVPKSLVKSNDGIPSTHRNCTADGVDMSSGLSEFENEIQNTSSKHSMRNGMEGTEPDHRVEGNDGTEGSDWTWGANGMDITSLLSDTGYEMPDTGRSVGGVCTAIEVTEPANGTAPKSLVLYNNGTPNGTPSVPWMSGANGMDMNSRPSEFGNEIPDMGSKLGGVADGIEGSELVFTSWPFESENELQNTGSKLVLVPNGMEGTGPGIYLQSNSDASSSSWTSGSNGTDVHAGVPNCWENDRLTTKSSLRVFPDEKQGRGSRFFLQSNSGTLSVHSYSEARSCTVWRSELENDTHSTESNFWRVGNGMDMRGILPQCENGRSTSERNLERAANKMERTWPGIPGSRWSSGVEGTLMDMNGSLLQCSDVTQTTQGDFGGQENSPQYANDTNTTEYNSEETGSGLQIGGAECHQKRSHHPQKAVFSLRHFFDNKTPYPNEREIYQLSKLPDLCGLTIKQINTWFCNEREKKRRHSTGSAGMNYKMQNNHPEAAIKVLRSWVHAHQGNDRPTKEQKILLAEQAGLTLRNVCYWFENYRKKQRKLALKIQTLRPEEMQVSEARQEILEVTEARVNTSEWEAHQPIVNEKLELYEIEYEVELPEAWDEDLWKSCAGSDTP